MKQTYEDMVSSAQVPAATRSKQLQSCTGLHFGCNDTLVAISMLEPVALERL